MKGNPRERGEDGGKKNGLTRRGPDGKRRRGSPELFKPGAQDRQQEQGDQHGETRQCQRGPFSTSLGVKQGRQSQASRFSMQRPPWMPLIPRGRGGTVLPETSLCVFWSSQLSSSYVCAPIVLPHLFPQIARSFCVSLAPRILYFHFAWNLTAAFPCPCLDPSSCFCSLVRGTPTCLPSTSLSGPRTRGRLSLPSQAPAPSHPSG